MNNKPNESDPELDMYLAGKSGLSDIYAASKNETVPEELSERIRNIARQELANEKKFRNWYIPLSLAASIILSITILTINSRSPDNRIDSPLVEHIPAKRQDNKLAVTKPKSTPDTNLATNKPQQPAIPQHIRDLVQPTAKRSSTIHDYPHTDELKTWPPVRWAKKIRQLKRDNEHELADKYLADFGKYYPQHDIHELIRQLKTD